jgi:hypothetical protein
MLLQGDQKDSMHLPITVQKHAKIQYFKQFQSITITEYIRNVYRAILNTVFENTVRRVNKYLEIGRGTLNITCNFLYFNHQVHRDFMITLYKLTIIKKRQC